MINLQSGSATRKVVVVEETPPAVTETVTITRSRPEERATWRGKDSRKWTFAELRDFVVTRIEEIHGSFPRSPEKEHGIFSAFHGRWGDMAGPIAECAFDVHKGMWRGAPIGVNRFCKASDPFFAQLIHDRLIA